jgi:hypothetical protein
LLACYFVKHACPARPQRKFPSVDCVESSQIELMSNGSDIMETMSRRSNAAPLCCTEHGTTTSLKDHKPEGPPAVTSVPQCADPCHRALGTARGSPPAPLSYSCSPCPCCGTSKSAQTYLASEQTMSTFQQDNTTTLPPLCHLLITSATMHLPKLTFPID